MLPTNLSRTQASGAVHWAITCLSSYDMGQAEKFRHEAEDLAVDFVSLEEQVLCALKVHDPALSEHIRRSTHPAD